MKLLFVAISLISTGCVSSKEEPTPIAKSMLYYKIEPGEPVKTEAPMPIYYPFYLQWYGKEKKLAYKGYDVDRDGRIDMLDILDDDQKVEMTAFDFDGDGMADRIVDKNGRIQKIK